MTMKNALLSFFFLSLITQIYGQKTEFSIGLNSGLFSFKGASTASTSSINFDDRNRSGYTNNPYGSNSGLCYGISGNLRKVSKKNFIVGFDLGFERLRSKVFVDVVNGFTGTSTYQSFGFGSSNLNLNCINLYPYFGKRFKAQKFSFDFLVGVDFAYIVSAYDKGSLFANNDATFEVSRERTTIDVDIKPRIQFGINYRRTGVYAGYSYGLANYHRGFDGALINDSHSEMIRFGLMYKLK
jgi:hypothetical protein